MKHGFDLTDMNVGAWEELVEKFNLTLSIRTDGDYFTWTGENNMVVTCNNPITGEYYKGSSRGREKGYASYIGVEGDPEFVREVVSFIRAHAEFIKDESENSRDFV